MVLGRSPDRKGLSGHPLDHDRRVPRGHGYSYAPAAILVRDHIDAELAARDRRRRSAYPRAMPDADILHALWIERCSIREVARRLDRDEKTIRDRARDAVASLEQTFPDIRGQSAPPHFQRNVQKPRSKGRSPVLERKPRPRPETTKSAPPTSCAELEQMVAAFVVAGGEIRKGPTGITRDHLEARAVFNLAKDTRRDDPSGTPGQQSHLRRRTGGAGAMSHHEAIAVPAKRLPGKAIKDDTRIGNARSHQEEVERLYRGHYFNELRYGERKADDREVDDLVEQFIDQVKDRTEQEKELRPKGIGSVITGRDRYKYTRWASELLKADRADRAARKTVAEEDELSRRAQLVKKLKKQKTEERRRKKLEPEQKRLGRKTRDFLRRHGG